LSSRESHGAPSGLALAEDPEDDFSTAAWIGQLVALGALLARLAARPLDRQLVVTISVPQRDYAAVLLTSGWVATCPAPDLAAPLEILLDLPKGTQIRLVNDQDVVTGTFSGLDQQAKPPRARFAGTAWLTDRIRALSVLSADEPQARTPKPKPGSVGVMARLEASWDQRLAAPARDVAIVGTVAWLQADLAGLLHKPGSPHSPSLLHDLVLPNLGTYATWNSRVFSASRFADQLPLTKETRLAVLDGAGAIKYLAEIEAPVVVCIIDRSIADESAADLVVQTRNTRGEPVVLSEALRWRPPPGVEAMAFSLAL
jgi:hypothetical protein